MKTLLNTYCVIETEEHLKALAEHQKWVSENYIGDAVAMGEIFDDYHFDAFDPEDLHHRTRVTVEQYIDLMTDRITPWRLSERGYECGTRNVWSKSFNPHNPILIEWCDGMVSVGGRHTSIETMADLANQERYLTPKP